MVATPDTDNNMAIMPGRLRHLELRQEAAVAVPRCQLRLVQPCRRRQALRSRSLMSSVAHHLYRNASTGAADHQRHDGLLIPSLWSALGQRLS